MSKVLSALFFLSTSEVDWIEGRHLYFTVYKTSSLGNRVPYLISTSNGLRTVLIQWQSFALWVYEDIWRNELAMI